MIVVWQSLIFSIIQGLALVWMRRELRLHRTLLGLAISSAGNQISLALKHTRPEDPSVINLRRCSDDDVARFEALLAQEKARRNGPPTPVAIPLPKDKP